MEVIYVEPKVPLCNLIKLKIAQVKFDINMCWDLEKNFWKTWKIINEGNNENLTICWKYTHRHTHNIYIYIYIYMHACRPLGKKNKGRYFFSFC